MAIYTYTTAEGKSYDMCFAMGKQPKSITTPDGVEAFHDIAATARGTGIPASSGWPIYSDAAGVHPSQINEFKEMHRKHGVQIDYTKDGRAIFKDAAHRRKCLKVRKMRDLQGFD